MNWKTILALLGAILIFLIVAFYDQIGKGVDKVENYYSNMFHRSVARGLYEGFKKTAEKLNRRGPVMKNKYVRFDKSEAGPGARMTNFYTLVKHPARDYDRARLSAEITAKLVRSLCDNNKIKPSLVLGATYAFVYRGNDGVEVSHIEVNEHSCDTQPTQAAEP